jgi:hypothetical protein
VSPVLLEPGILVFGLAEALRMVPGMIGAEGIEAILRGSLY